MQLAPSLPDLRETVYPYETPGFHQCWWEHLAPRFSIRDRHNDLLILEKPVFNGIITLGEMRVAGWNTAISQDMPASRVSDFANFARNTRWDYFRMTWSEDRQDAQAFDALEALGYPIFQLPGPPSYTVDISQGWEAYLQNKGSATRKDIRRKLRDVQSLKPRLDMLEGEDAIEPFFQALFRHHLAYWDSKTGYSYFHHPGERAFIMAWAAHLHQTGNLSLTGLYFGDTLVNLSVRLLYNDIAYGILTVNTAAYPNYYPGIVSQYLNIEEVANRGIRLYNLGPGNYPHKVQAANRVVPQHELVVANPRSPLGMAYAKWLQRRLRQLNQV